MGFESLINKKFENKLVLFRDGLAWINRNWGHAEIRSVIERFEKNVVEPMDKEWQAMNDDEKEYFLRK